MWRRRRRENNKNEEEKEEDFPGEERKKCDQEPIFKIYWSCLPLSKHYTDKEDAVCEV